MRDTAELTDSTVSKNIRSAVMEYLGWGLLALKRRHDLIPNLVEVVKDYMSYEQETLEKVIKARNNAVNAANTEDAILAEGILSGAMGKLFALMENYPDLKANESTARLMEELSATENKISFSRQFYNDSVMSPSHCIRSSPTISAPSAKLMFSS